MIRLVSWNHGSCSAEGGWDETEELQNTKSDELRKKKKESKPLRIAANFPQRRPE